MRAFDPELTLVSSGQVFHWQAVEGTFCAAVEGRLLRAADEDAFARKYFDDGRDYAAVARVCAKYPCAARAVARLPGLRVLNQPPWEALVAFILSANNNVARIRGIIDRLNRRWGYAVDFRGHTLYGFPSPETLARVSEDALCAETGCGYRAPYLIDAARRVENGFDLRELAEMPYDEARARLMTVKGVGEKVANCVLLFGCGHASAFPVDVWVARLMETRFDMRGLSRLQIQARGRAMFGPDAGVIQQYLFHCARMGLLDD